MDLQVCLHVRRLLALLRRGYSCPADYLVLLMDEMIYECMSEWDIFCYGKIHDETTEERLCFLQTN